MTQRLNETAAQDSCAPPLERQPLKFDRGFLKNPKKPHPGETIGGGFFVFRRGENTNRIRAPYWPFEHATLREAILEAERLAADNPGHDYIVVAECHTALVEPQPQTATSEEAA